MQVLRECFAAFERGDLDAIRTYIAEDAGSHYSGRGMFGGDHQGADRMIEVMGKAVELTGGT